ncbi:hypothetical protein D3C81_2162820 [compost metagenome]
MFLLFTVNPVLMIDHGFLDIQVGPMVLGNIRELDGIRSIQRTPVKHLIDHYYSFSPGQIGIRFESAVRVSLK